MTTANDTGPAADGAEDQDHEHSDGAGDTDTRLDRLESAVDQIKAAVDRLLPGSRGEAQQRTEDRLDRPTDVQTAVRAELERRDRVAAEQAAADKDKAEREDLRTQVARLSEQPPARPVPRRTRMLGWGE